MNRIKQIQDLKSDENVILDGNLALDSGIFYHQDINAGEEENDTLNRKLVGVNDEPGPSSSLDTGYESSHQVQMLHPDPEVWRTFNVTADDVSSECWFKNSDDRNRSAVHDACQLRRCCFYYMLIV